MAYPGFGDARERQEEARGVTGWSHYPYKGLTPSRPSV
jgi:hypothetical protein